MSELKQRISEDMKALMRAKEKARLTAVRSILAAVKQKEVDERCELSDDEVLAILTKLAKQRKESISQYEKAGRQDLIDIEVLELEVISQYLPKPLAQEEITHYITKAIEDTGASGIQDMGKVMAQLKPQLAGRADMAKVSNFVKTQLMQ